MSRALVPAREPHDSVLLQLIVKHGFLLGRSARTVRWEKGRKKGSFRLRFEKGVRRKGASYLIVDPVTSEFLGVLRDRRPVFRDGLRLPDPRTLHLYLMPRA